MEQRPVLDVQHVSFAYEGEPVLEEVNLTLFAGDFLGLVGPNGSGKTTLIKCILGLEKPMRGNISLFGSEPAQARTAAKVGYVSQKANSFNTNFPATVFEVVSTGLYGQLGLFKRLSKQDKQRVHDAIDRVGLAHFSKRPIGKLSGGQQQRAFIARALVSEPKLLILDEPTVGVDAKSVEQFYALIADLRRQYELTVLLVSHDIGVMTSKVNRVACLNKRLYFHGNPEEFEQRQNDILSAAYGHEVRLLEHSH
ncbi:metal ABC transporter ATP-binding protein [Numidum massiliense]|uniref:metal ABC transporter ATP-binding protein n=1 Tax=Numidum massiliense TaxID=1522315 RepID=UPI0006D54142|nr:metal ABC transporter ATP-binding protein [Numidum massiliense]